MFVPHPALRASPFSWEGAVRSALKFIGEDPLPNSILSALTMIDTYQCGTTEMPVEKADLLQVCGMLLALDLHTACWPDAVQQRLKITHVVKDQTTIVITRPLTEAVVALYNGAVEQLKSGLHLLSYVHSEEGRRSSLAGNTGLPNVNAKKAYQTISVAVELAELSLHTVQAGGERPLTPGERASLETQLDMKALLDICTLCAATSKYTFALSSSATASKSEALAKVAFIAASYSTPARLPTASTFRILPTVMLSAFHCHKAEQYYSEDEMGPAIGHIGYAVEILIEVTNMAAAKNYFHQHSWQSILKAVKNVLGAEKEETLSFNHEPDASVSVVEAAKAFSKLIKMVENSNDLVKVFPYFQLLLKTEFDLLKKYEKENNVVYFAKPLDHDAVRRDIPDIEALLPSGGEWKSVKVSAQALQSFRALPEPEILDHILSEQNQREKAVQETARLIPGLQHLINDIGSQLELPSDVAAALDTLEPCLADSVGSVENALELAKVAVQGAYEDYQKELEDWRRVAAGEMPSHAGKEVEKAVSRWSKDCGKVLQLWVSTVGNDCTSLSEISEAVYPVTLYRESFLPQATALLERAQERVARGDTDASLDEEIRSAVKNGETVLKEIRKLQTTLKKEYMPLLNQTTELLWSAPTLVKEVEEAKGAVAQDAIRARTEPTEVPKPKVETQDKKEEKEKEKEKEKKAPKSKRSTSSKKRGRSTKNTKSSKRKEKESSTESYDGSANGDEVSSENSVHSSALGTPREVVEEENEVTEATVNQKLLSRIKQKRANRK